METNEILKGNKLIAEFMKAKNENSDIYYLPEFGHYFNSYGQIEYNECFRSNELKYHSSWDWLMPVIKKCLIGECKNKFDYSYLYESLCNIDLKETFIEVVEYIKWYNLNN